MPLPNHHGPWPSRTTRQSSDSGPAVEDHRVDLVGVGVNPSPALGRGVAAALVGAAEADEALGEPAAVDRMGDGGRHGHGEYVREGEWASFVLRRSGTNPRWPSSTLRATAAEPG